jgi:NADH-quinone oxidoreductase subunit N
MLTGFGGQVVSNGFTFIMTQCTLITSLLFFFYTKYRVYNDNFPEGEFYALSLLSILGSLVLISSNSLLTVYVGIELLSLPLYALLSLYRQHIKSAESAVKYFIIGALASGLLLYGMSLLYGITGTIDISEIRYFIENSIISIDITYIAVSLLLVSAVFKLGVAPFHMWVPDIYEGSSKSISLFISSVPKFAIFSMVIDLLVTTTEQFSDWKALLIILAVLSTLFGSFLALNQINVKRLIGYSTITNSGFILLGAVLSPYSYGIKVSLYYLISYILMITAFFAIIFLLDKREYSGEELTNFLGLDHHNSRLAFLTLITVFSMAGIPPFCGFVAKLLIITGLVDQGYYILCAYILITAIISIFYYLRLIKIIYFEQPTDKKTINSTPSFILVFQVSCILIFGIFPFIIIDVINYFLFN